MPARSEAPRCARASRSSRVDGPREVMRVFFAILFAVAGFLAVYAARDLIRNPYTDRQIQESMVDTWEVEAIYTLIVIGTVILISIVVLILAITQRGAIRRLGFAIVMVSVLAGVLQVASHAKLTSRTTRLTGQTFSRAYGLF